MAGVTSNHSRISEKQAATTVLFILKELTASIQ